MSEPTLRDRLAAVLDAARPDLASRLDDDPAAYLELVALARDADAETGQLLRAAVVSARRAGCTWEQVGGILGMTRQAVQQRFGRALGGAADDGRPDDESADDERTDDEPRDDESADDELAAEPGAGATAARVAPERRVLAPVTAFGELPALRRLGRFGWHAVGYGVLRFDLERSDRQWEHRRQLVWQPPPDGAGWREVGPGWFPWAYYARPLDEAALVAPPGYDPFEV